MKRIPVIRRAILAERTVLNSLMWVAIAVAVPTAVRWVIDQGANGMPFVTYYPAVLLASVVLGARYGAATAIISAIVANRMFWQENILNVAFNTGALLLLFAISCAILVDAGAMLGRLVRMQEGAKEQEEHLNQELLHRVRNMITVVQSLARLSARHSQPADFIDAFNGRLVALGKANELLGVGKTVHCEIQLLVESAIAPFRNDGNFHVSGPQCELPKEACVPFVLAVHELCTNAAKYGSLSSPGGTVTVEWSLDPAAEATLNLRWAERGGPPVKEKTRTGMGTLLLRPQGGLKDVQLHFLPDGVVCEMVIERVAC